MHQNIVGIITVKTEHPLLLHCYKQICHHVTAAVAAYGLYISVKVTLNEQGFVSVHHLDDVLLVLMEAKKLHFWD